MSENKAYDADFQMEEVFQHFVSEKKLINEENPSIDIFNIDFFKVFMENSAFCVLKQSYFCFLSTHYQIGFFS